MGDLRRRITQSHKWWLIKRHTSWRIEGWLLAWTEGVEPCDDYEARLLAEDDSGDWLVPAGYRDGWPSWQGYWRWWRPDHWPVYVRSRRAQAYVMVERWSE